MITRTIAKELKILRREYPVIAITGPRQSGKTTLAKAIFPRKPYISFEDPLVRSRFSADPHGFMKSIAADGAVMDEVQHVPDLFSYLQGEVDSDPRTGRFILTGSQQFGMIERITQSLAGRIGLLELLPFDLAEIKKIDQKEHSWDQQLLLGGYPAIYDRHIRPQRWYADYLATYIQRDVRQISQIHNLDTFTLFLKLCAGHVGQLVNTNKWAAACSVDHKTIKHWLSILQASYVVRLLPPYHTNFKKRLVKTSKLYFYDTGLACRLLDLNNDKHIAQHPLRGALVENWVFSELVKGFLNRGCKDNLFFWRTYGGEEIDFVADTGKDTMLIEVKSGVSLRPEWTKPMHAWAQRAEAKSARPYVVYGGEDRSIIQGCTFLGWRDIGSIQKRLT
jgi:predicted AAA+ superfamily ATPase